MLQNLLQQNTCNLSGYKITKQLCPKKISLLFIVQLSQILHLDDITALCCLALGESRSCEKILIGLSLTKENNKYGFLK